MENKTSGVAPLHHSPLFRSQHTHSQSVEEGVLAHLEAGIPPHQLVLGIHFASKGLYRDLGLNWKNVDPDSEVYTMQWDNIAMASWLADKEGDYMQTYECPRAIAYKCEYAHNMGLRGAMYWQYTSDRTGDLRKAVYEEVMKHKKQ